MAQTTDARVTRTELHFIPVQTRVPLKFGTEVVTGVTCARTRLTIRDQAGRTASGWGATPLSVQWVWPGTLPYDLRHAALKEFMLLLGKAWTEFDAWGHPIELGYDFQLHVLRPLLQTFNAQRAKAPLPWLAALLCCSVFDQALHDAYGILHHRPIYHTYNRGFMSRDLGHFLKPAGNSPASFTDQFPDAFLSAQPPARLRAWHLVGGLDAVEPDQLTGSEPKDGYPVLLRDWIRRDGLKCLKIKLRGNDAAWDYARWMEVGRMAIAEGVEWLSADFNCTVREPAYVTEMLDRMRDEQPRLYGMLLYVEQPFPYELEEHRIDVRSVSARKPLFLDESAHDWEHVRLGRDLGWTGVALKTCKTQTGALLSACWARAHGMTLMVQDLTNPMLAQIPHVLLAAHAGTIMGVETNSMQFYPEASRQEAAVHPGLYRREDGCICLSTIQGSGFGYRWEEIRRQLGEPVSVHST